MDVRPSRTRPPSESALPFRGTSSDDLDRRQRRGVSRLNRPADVATTTSIPLLSERQKRERDFYREYARRHTDEDVDFDPVLGREQRPWNPYWAHFQVVRSLFTNSRQRLLDFGCGAGTASMCYAKVGYRVHGFDICDDNVSSCYGKAERYGFGERVEFSVQVAESLEYPSRHFDVVAGIDILHHVDIAAAIREVHRVLKPAGVAVFREFVEVPVFDALRASWLVTRFYPKGASFGHHRTHDERKLDADDLGMIRSVFPRCEITRFNLLQRFRKLWPIASSNGPSTLEKIDQRIFRIAPVLQRFGGDVLMVLRKE